VGFNAAATTILYVPYLVSFPIRTESQRRARVINMETTSAVRKMSAP